MLVEGRLESLRLLLLLLPIDGDIWGIKQVRVEVFLEIVVARLVGGSCVVLDAAEEASVRIIAVAMWQGRGVDRGIIGRLHGGRCEAVTCRDSHVI